MSASTYFCNHCGAKTSRRIPPGDNFARQCCDQCGAIHYSNPKMVLGTLPMWGDQVLLCRRAIEPQLGKWTLPAGFMEDKESTAQGAVRETMEEAGADITLLDMYTLISVPHISQIHCIYLAQLNSPDFHPGEETLEARLFSEDEIPWDEIAFRTIALTLKHYFADRKQGNFPFRSLALSQPPAAAAR